MASQMSRAVEATGSTQEHPLDLEHEFDLARSAIALLAAGGARRVTLVGLPLNGQALREIESLVRAHGMSMRAVSGHVGYDLTVEAGG